MKDNFHARNDGREGGVGVKVGEGRMWSNKMGNNSLLIGRNTLYAMKSFKLHLK